MRRLSVNGVERTYYLHVPAGSSRRATGDHAARRGDDGEGCRAWLWLGRPRQQNSRFVVAGPDASTLHADRAPGRENIRVWNSVTPVYPGNIAKSDDTAFIVAMIDDIARTDGIDLRRVYVAGFSSGGHMANRLGQEIAGRLAAISTSGARQGVVLAAALQGHPDLVFGRRSRSEHTDGGATPPGR